MTPVALDLLFVGVAGGGIALLGVLRAWGVADIRRERRAVHRAAVARRDAQWEAHTYYQGGLAVITTRRVARWDGKEAVVETDKDSNVILPEVDTEGITRAQIDAGLRAQHRNMQQRHGGDL